MSIFVVMDPDSSARCNDSRRPTTKLLSDIWDVHYVLVTDCASRGEQNFGAEVLDMVLLIA